MLVHRTKLLKQWQDRTGAIAAEIEGAFAQDRKVLVLTERTEHLDAIRAALDRHASALFVLLGRMSKKQRGALIAQLDALPPEAPRILLATGKLIGEGFDHPPFESSISSTPATRHCSAP